MPFSAGVYSLPTPALVPGQTVASTENNTSRNDFAAALNLTMLRNGTSTATANLPMGGYKLTGLGVATTLGDALSYNQAAVVSNLTDTALTITRVPYVSTGGLLIDSASFTFDGTTLTAGGFSTSGNIAAATASISGNITVTGGTANGVAYLNGSKVLTSGSALTFDGTNLGVGGTATSFGASYSVITATGSSAGVFQSKTTGADARFYATATDTLFGNWNTNPLRFIIDSSEQMRLTSTGLGIGTSSPSYKLDVSGVSKAGTLQASGSAAGSFSADSWFVQNEGSSTNRMYYCGANASTFGILAEYSAYSNGSPAITRYVEANQQIFYTSAAERMRIDSSGNLLVGTTSQPNGTYRQVINYAGNGGQGGIMFNDTDGGSTYQACYFRKDGAQRGYINVTTSGTTYATVSDYRLKTEATPMVDALSKVLALNPVAYKWKETGKDGQGFIAHELQAIVPDCVTGEKDAVDEEGKPVYQCIDTSFLVATLCKAIQELKAEVDQLKGAK